jgi:hypothetical protein
MKSRRRIASSKARDHAKFGRQLRPSEQEIVTSEMGFKGQFAMQKFLIAQARDGSGTSF